MENQRVAAQLDALRGTAAIAVVAGHAYQAFVADALPMGRQIAGLVAQAAVMIFFVLSGYLITSSIRRNIAANGSFDGRQYVVGRFNRIYPPLLFALVITGAAYLAAPEVFPNGCTEFVARGIRSGIQIDGLQVAGTMVFVNGFLTGNLSANGPLWSLAFEVWFYIIAGLIAARSKPSALSAAMLVAALGALNHLFAIYLAVWGAGACVALIGTKSALPCRVTLIAAALAATFYIGTNNYGALVSFNVAVGLSAALIMQKIIATKIVLPTFGKFAAPFSYTLYLTHFPLMLLVFGILQTATDNNIALALASAFVFVGVAIGFARVTAPIIETVRPLSRLPRGRAMAVLAHH